MCFLVNYDVVMQGFRLLQTNPDIQFTTIQFLVMVGTFLAMVLGLIVGVMKTGAKFQTLVGRLERNEEMGEKTARSLYEVNKSLQTARSRIINIDRERRNDKQKILSVEQCLQDVDRRVVESQKETQKIFEEIKSGIYEIKQSLGEHLAVHKDRDQR
jgi:hypothetical protein